MMHFGDPLVLAAATVLFVGCSSESEDSETAETSPGPGSAAPTSSAPASGLQFSPLEGAAKSVAESARAEADVALVAACACSGVGATGPCASGTFNWAAVQLSKCYYAAFDADPAAVSNVETCLKESLQAIGARYEARTTCGGEQGLALAQLEIESSLRICGLLESNLMPKLNECDGAPTGP